MKNGMLLLSLAALLVTTLLMGCNRGETFEGPRIALVLKTLNNPFFNDLQNGAEEAARELEVNLLVQAAQRETDVEAQMQIVENLIQMRVDAIALTPSGSKEIIPAIRRANAAGIPVIIVDTRIDDEAAAADGAHYEAFIGSDNYEGGRLAGQYVVDKTGGSATVAILEGIPGHETADARMQGFRDAVSDHPDVRIVASQPANWERDQGYTVFQNILQARPNIDVLFAANDMMALGAIEAIAAAGRSGEIMIIGFDATTDARHAIEEGTMEASVAQFPGEMGRVAVETAVAVLNGGTVEREIPVQIELVTREQMASMN